MFLGSCGSGDMLHRRGDKDIEAEYIAPDLLPPVIIRACGAAPRNGMTAATPKRR